MFDRRLGRRASLFLPLLLVACGGEERIDFPTLRFTYLPPIRLNVATIVIEQHYQPTGIPPDVSQLDPDPPADALRAMAQDRLKPYGVTGRAVFIIQDASLIRQGDVITGSMRVRLEVYSADNVLLGFAEAAAGARHTGRVGDLRETLYDMTKSMMDNMNVEFELQVNNNLHDVLATGTASPTQVEQAPLDGAAPPAAPPTPGDDGTPPTPGDDGTPPTPVPLTPGPPQDMVR